MWDCGPYADLYEEFEEEWGEYEWFEDSMRQPMEFAKNNMRAFMFDVEQTSTQQVGALCEFSNTKPVGGRFQFHLSLKAWRSSERTWEFLVWMPGQRLSQIRDMPATTGPRQTVLLNSASLLWEEAVTTIRNSMQDAVS